VSKIIGIGLLLFLWFPSLFLNWQASVAGDKPHKSHDYASLCGEPLNISAQIHQPRFPSTSEFVKDLPKIPVFTGETGYSPEALIHSQTACRAITFSKPANTWQFSARAASFPRAPSVC